MKNFLNIFLLFLLVTSIQVYAQNSSSSTSDNPFLYPAKNASVKMGGAALSDSSAKEIRIDATTGCLPVSVFPWTEGFGIAETIPEWWTQADNVGNGEIWQFGTIKLTTTIPILSGNYAYLNSHNYQPGNSQNADLISPALDLSSFSTVTLRFKHYFIGFTKSSAALSYSIDGGTSWTRLAYFSTTSNKNPEVFTQEIAAVAGESNVKFKWNYTGAYDWYWAIDDVTVFEVTGHDVSVVSFDFEKSAVHTTGIFSPRATVKNNGTNTETFAVKMTIGAYTSTQKVTALASDSSSLVTFDPWTAIEGDYPTQVCTLLPGDLNMGNNCKSRVIKVLNLNKQVFGYNSYANSGTDHAGPVTFRLAYPGILNSLPNQSVNNLVSAGTWAEGQWYCSVYDIVAPYDFIKINPNTGERTVIGATSVCMYGLSYNTVNNVMYGIDYNGTNSNLYSINLSTGDATLIGKCGNNLLINLAINDAGLAYAIDIAADALGTVNLATGTFTNKGSIGFDASFAQDMEFDLESGELYMAAVNLTTNTGYLAWVNQETGATMKIGDFEGGAKITGLSIPYTASKSVQKKLAAGWTWFSLNVKNADRSVATVLSSLKPCDGDYIKNQTVSATYYDGTGWFGELTRIDPREMYKIRLGKANILIFSGRPVDPGTYPILLKTGLNWIGHIPQSDETVSEALLTMSPESDDYIKNQTASSTFYEGSGWFGELNVLEPLDGFMLKTNHNDTLTFPEPATGDFTDTRDGKTYTWKKIGVQTWMTENLAWLPSVNPSSISSITGSCYYVYGYEGDIVSDAKATDNYTAYGVLYNWPAALGACPVGWHLPDDSDWLTLTDYLTEMGFGYQGSGPDIGKSLADASGWKTTKTAGMVGNDQASNNSSGFTARPGGSRLISGSFGDLVTNAYFWSASEYGTSSWLRSLVFSYNSMSRFFYARSTGLSVRCLRND